jgi:hypothetical protein
MITDSILFEYLVMVVDEKSVTEEEEEEEGE